MTGADGKEAADLDQRVAQERGRTMTVRLRLLAWATIAIVVSFIAGNPTVRSGSTTPYFALRVSALVILGGFLLASYRPRFARYQSLWALMMAIGIASLSANGGMLRGDVAVTATLHIILVLTTAAVLPWGTACQIAIVLACIVLMAAVVAAVGLPAPGDTSVLVLINAGAGYFLSLFVAHQTRSAFDRGVRENLNLREAEERNRSLNEGLEAKVRARTAELEGALADQRAVTRAISHDLRQPLRHIEGYARMLEDDLGSRLEPQHLERLDRVRTATLRTGRMVDALLEFSRVSGRPLQRRSFDLSDCALEFCREMAAAEPGRQAEFKIAPDLSENCDPGLTRNLLRELLANSWKFTREQPVACIEVGRRDGAWFVSDNGAGFDMQHTSRLFRAFERLHHAAEFEGEGMGLAIAERIVRSHGGRIWAESVPGSGATFLFTLQGEG